MSADSHLPRLRWALRVSTAALLSLACAIGVIVPGAAGAGSVASIVSAVAAHDDQPDTIRTEASERQAPKPARLRRRLAAPAARATGPIARIVRWSARLVPQSPAAWRGPPVLLI